MKAFQHLFGPVQSRRLGRSLGVDLLGGRYCSFDCVFCEVGRTTHCTSARREYVPFAEVERELRAWFAAGADADIVTLAGQGEPTLHTAFGGVIDLVHVLGPLPVAILSNGSLMHDPDVRRDAARADLVKVSLGAWDDASLVQLNHPARGVRFDVLLEGLVAFRQQFEGELRLEVMLVAGINDTADAVKRIAACAERIAADQIELNTVARPPADPTAQAVPADKMLAFAAYFGPQARVIAAQRPSGVLADSVPLKRSEWQPLLARRACTAEQVASGLGRDRALVESELEAQVCLGTLERVVSAGQLYYRLKART